MGKEYENYPYRLDAYRDYLFQIACFDSTCNFYSMHLHQITEGSTRHFVMRDRRRPTAATTQYYAVDTSLNFHPTKDALVFKPCYQEAFINEYFSVDTDYTGGQRAINDFVHNRYVPPTHSSGQSGYVRIRFIVNCRGQTGRFDVQTTDLSYQPATFDPDIVQQLITIVQQLDRWIPGHYDNSTEAVDSYKFLGFRLVDGQITQIVP